jgi:hypothetical protein
MKRDNPTNMELILRSKILLLLLSIVVVVPFSLADEEIYFTFELLVDGICSDDNVSSSSIPF